MPRGAEATHADAIAAETIASLKAWSRRAGVLLVLLGVTVLIGWACELTALERVTAQFAPMKPNTALCFIFCGSALWLDGALSRRAERFRRIAIYVTLALTCSTLLEHLTRVELHIDELLFRERWQNKFPGRMSIATAASFALLCLAQLTLDGERRRFPRAPHVWLATAVALCAFFVLLGYLYGVRSLYAIEPFNTTALHTAAGLFIGSLAVLCARPRRGPLRIVISSSPGGLLARRTLPAVFLFPIALGWLRVKGQEGGFYGTGFGTAMFAAANIAFLSALLLWTARALVAIDDVRRQAAARLHESEVNLTLTLNSIADAVVATDLNGLIVRMNPVATQLTGWSFKEAAGKPFCDVFRIYSEDTKEPAEDAVSRVLRDGTLVGLAQHTVIVARDGRERPVFTSGSPIRDAGGALRGVVLTFRDQTAERKTQRAIREGDARKTAMLEAALDGIVSMDHKGRITEVNPAAERAFGYARDEALGRRFVNLIGSTSLRDLEAILPKNLDDTSGVGKRVERQGLRADGSTFPIELSIVPARAGGPATYTVYVRDLSERQQQAEALQISEARFRHLADAGVIGVIVADMSGRIDEVNDAYLQIVGYTREDVERGKLKIPELTPPEWRELDQAALVTFRDTGSVGAREKEYVRKDGTRAQVLVGGAALDPTRYIAFVLDLSGQKRAEQVGARAVELAQRATSERERAEAQLKDTELQLRQSQKMEAIGTLAGGVAHDFNNVLSVIISYAQLSMSALGPNDALRADIEQIARAGQRASELTQQLLAFSRQQVLEPKVIRIDDAISGLTSMLGRLIGEDIELSVRPKTRRHVFVDPGQIEQVLLNLAVNARDAMPRGGKLTIETSDVELDDRFAAEHLGVEPGSYVMLCVSDTGKGMDRATQARVFEPFFTTKERGKGTGLGLSTVFGIVKQSGGSIWVYSELGQGTTFKIYLPESKVTLQSEEAPVSIRPRRGSETVLLTEDDEQVRNLASTILRKHGYKVLEAATGGDAVTICEQYQGKIDVLLTDVVMPRMSGRQLWEQVAPVRPSMKVLFMSGYTDDAIVHHGVLSSELSFVQKPLLPTPLLSKLRRVLDQS